MGSRRSAPHVARFALGTERTARRYTESPGSIFTVLSRSCFVPFTRNCLLALLFVSSVDKMGRVLNTTAPAARSAVRPAVHSKPLAAAVSRVSASKVCSMAASCCFLFCRFIGAVPPTPMVGKGINVRCVFVHRNVLIGVYVGVEGCHRTSLAVSRRLRTTLHAVQRFVQ